MQINHRSNVKIYLYKKIIYKSRKNLYVNFVKSKRKKIIRKKYNYNKQ